MKQQTFATGSAFIGRRPEMETLRAALDQARGGHCRVVMLAGEPGIGKTRTAHALVDYAARHDTLVLWGRCSEEPGAPPYWPWLQAIRAYAEHNDNETLRATLGIAASYVADLDPNLARRLPGVPPTAPSADAGQARFQLFDAIAEFLRNAARQTLVLVLDDLHRADTPSLRLLEFIAAEVSASQLMIVGTYRDSEMTREHPLSDTLAELARHDSFQRLHLTGLSQDETADFLNVVGGLAATREMAASLYETTEGHPLFLTEMVRFFEAGSGRRADARRIPEGIREVIGSRLNRLTPLGNRVLGNAAVIGRDFALDLLLRLIDDTPEDQCLAALEEGLAARLIEELPEPGGYQFSHSLIRETLYEEMPAPRRIRLHQRVGAALEERYGSDLTPCLSMLAYHYHAARPIGPSAKAYEYARRAGQRADEMFAFEEAARLYQLAVQAIAPDMDLERCELLLALGEVLNKMGDSPSAFASFGAAAETARRLSSATLFARAAVGCWNVAWRTMTGTARAAVLLQEALRLLPTTDSCDRAALLSAWCRALIFCDRLDEAEPVHHEAVAMARRLDDPVALFHALCAIMPALWWHKFQQLGLRASSEAIELAKGFSHPEWAVARVTGYHIGGLMELGDVAGARTMTKSYLEAAETMRQPFFQAVGWAMLAMLTLHEGRFAEAEQLALRAKACGDRAKNTIAAGVFSVQMFTLRREQGRLRELAPMLEQFRDAVPDEAKWRPGMAVLLCELGQDDEAHAIFEALAADKFTGITRDGIWLGSIAYLAEVCVWLGDATRATTLYELLVPYAERSIMFGGPTVCFGAAGRLLGMLATTLERWDLAQGHFEAAVQLDTATGGRPWLAHTQHEYAAMLMRRNREGDATLATSLAESAIATSRLLGMRALEERAGTLAQTARAHLSQPRYPAGLTEREVEVLRLVAAGKSNQEIARLLFRSRYTVANHVRNILTKTNAANRTEAAGFAMRHGLLKQ